MKHYLLPKDVTFYKANLHCHTTVSDGCLSPEEVKAMYVKEGYAAVAFTDHEALVDQGHLSDEHFIALNGYETAIKPSQVPTGSHPMMPVHHINIIKRRPHDTVQFLFYPENFTPGHCREHIPFLKYTGEICTYEYTTEFIHRMVEEAHAQGCLIHYNHPRWSLQTAETLSPFIDAFDGLEVMNNGCRDQGDCTPLLYEELLRAGHLRSTYVTAGDDNHNDGGAVAESFGAATYIGAKTFTYEGLTDALARGDSYISEAPRIFELYVEDGYAVIHTSAAASITLHSEGRLVAKVGSADGYVDRAAFPLSKERQGAYIRFEVTDSQGKRAYTRAYFLAQIPDLA